MTKKKRARSRKATGKQVNKSAAIRDVLAKDPSRKPQAIVQALACQGTEVSAAFVSQVKLKMRHRGARRTKRVAATGLSQFSGSDLIESKRLIDKLGVAKARAAIELLAKLY